MRKRAGSYKKAKKIKNLLLLPTEYSLEQLLATFLYHLPDNNPLRQEIDVNFNHQYCFQDFTLENIQQNRLKAKEWFRKHLLLW